MADLLVTVATVNGHAAAPKRPESSPAIYSGRVSKVAAGKVYVKVPAISSKHEYVAKVISAGPVVPGNHAVVMFDERKRVWASVQTDELGTGEALATDAELAAATAALSAAIALKANQTDFAAHTAGVTGVHGIPTMTDGQGALWSGGGWVATSLATLADARFPTTNEKAALAGVGGSPSSGNKYVTDLDTRLFISVKSYGAVGDGVANDQAAIQNAINAAAGRIVYFPEGTYRINTPIRVKPGTYLLGGHSPAWMYPEWTGVKMQLVAGAGWSGASLIECYETSITGDPSAPNGCRFEGLFLNCNSLAARGIYWRGDARDHTIRDVEVAGHTTAGFQAEGNGANPCQELNFWHCMAGVASGHGWLFQSGSYDHRLIGCVARNNSGDGFIMASGCASIEFISCRSEWNTGTGFTAFGSGDKVTFTDCKTDSNGANGFFLQYTAGGPLTLNCCFTNRDTSSGVRINACTGPVHIVGLSQRNGRNDGAAPPDVRPIYGVNLTSVSTNVLLQGYLAGITLAFREDASGNAWKFSGTTALNNFGTVSWQDPTISDSSTTVKGVTKMSVAPATATNPIAVGDNDGRVPLQAENDALIGTSGTPSSSNKYVTDADPRVPTQGENDGLVGTSGTPGTANKYVTNADSRNSDSRAPNGSAGGDLTGSYPNPTIALAAVTGAKGKPDMILSGPITGNGTAISVSPTWTTLWQPTYTTPAHAMQVNFWWRVRVDCSVAGPTYIYTRIICSPTETGGITSGDGRTGLLTMGTGFLPYTNMRGHKYFTLAASTAYTFSIQCLAQAAGIVWTNGQGENECVGEAWAV